MCSIVDYRQSFAKYGYDSSKDFGRWIRGLNEFVTCRMLGTICDETGDINILEFALDNGSRWSAVIRTTVLLSALETKNDELLVWLLEMRTFDLPYALSETKKNNVIISTHAREIISRYPKRYNGTVIRIARIVSHLQFEHYYPEKEEDFLVYLKSLLKYRRFRTKLLHLTELLRDNEAFKYVEKLCGSSTENSLSSSDEITSQ